MDKERTRRNEVKVPNAKKPDLPKKAGLIQLILPILASESAWEEWLVT